MDSHTDILQNPVVNSIGFTEKALAFFEGHINSYKYNGGAVGLEFLYHNPLNNVKAYSICFNGETMNRTKGEVDTLALIVLSKQDVRLASSVYIFNCPVEALSYLSLKDGLKPYEALVVFPKTFKTEHVDVVKTMFPKSRPICSFGKGQLAALQDAQFLLAYTGKAGEIKISQGFDGIQVNNLKGKTREYDYFSMRNLIIDFYRKHYDLGPKTLKPLKYYDSFLQQLCKRKQLH
ncbi:hypothetical protein [Flagellimonas flava]|uniref:hypothetical protein n=1 Tax=Flagellimonas flava TaxID=570519 RepID=UPI003D64D2B9